MMEEPAVGRVSEPNMNEWVVFDFPIDYMIWMENVFDPMHVDFVHNGTALTNDKFEPKNALPVTQFRQARDSKANSGFHLSVGKFNKAGKSRLEMCFKPPSLLAQSLMVEGVLPVDVLQYFVPVRPGLLRIFFGSRAEKPTKINNGILGFFLPRALAAVALWFRELPLLLLPSYIRLSLRHLLGPSNIKNIANQDTSVLHSQDKQLARENWDWKRFFLPTLGDVGVAAFRRWADKFANGGPAWHRSAGKNAVEDLRHVDLFSRWEHHTQWCPTCRKSVKFLGGLEDLLPKLTWAFVAVAVGLIANTSRIAYLRVAFGALAAAAVTLLARFEVQKLRARFLTDIPSSGIPEVAHGWPS
ncbi:unnamed protein product [Ostreobium quekettii]|uniref:Pheophorbide a oxygenase n=1 Tax=Ostreobium quekettii TaxID=121088 RepID=A0A8S1J222_9CHLO|nr:unnamed protein product [Ostreobium quekettii]